ncbi:manO protein [Tetragenococcus halophilus subsp. halophilus]|uniref:ManO protein n=3 Tax=Tetragenococcus halophilus TaxID=51669 RepID=A0A2H6CQ44_TETHA|nr:manO protein [Tetragenococcus halophilus subsp. halophilus]GBD67864.1 manO protein [Tetragenococcus halophilus subsp. halophilus]GBD71261.1 manO protein [Tetragenococcus halophilus subsp. halophilus]GBD77219.1 manO protein [Tetragenococcus halophilus subsp. halophilus]
MIHAKITSEVELYMVQSLNTKIDLTMDATSFVGLAKYGQVLIGDKAFEFYNTKNAQDYIQIPWEEVDYVVASVLFKGKWIPRYAIETKKDGTFNFASKDTKKVLRAMRPYVAYDHMVQANSFFKVIKRGLLSFGKKKKRSR